ncbi:evC complex member EVC [Pleurodeles waltl]|uniref:evC complex member EVC n=1 Tax=Pleurodeles waltl TaxID=8319 RepID=UPI003709B72E
MADSCLSDVVLRVSVESLQVVPGLMAAAVVIGALLGVIAGALLCFFVFVPRLRKKKDDSSKVLRNFDSSGVKERRSKKQSGVKKKKTENEVHKGDMLLEDDELSAPGDIAAFASRAKVIYPINQKFRPLADGASNPSLHENCKQTPLPNQMMDSSSASSDESLSQGEKDDCSSSTTVHSATSDDRFYERTFVKVSCFPDLLTCDSYDVKLCLYSLHLKGLPLLIADLRQEKNVMFIQVIRLYFTDLLMKKKIDRELFLNVLSTLEADFKELEEQFHSRMASGEISAAHDSAYETLEDIARKEKEHSDYMMLTLESFWKQLEKVHQFLLEDTKCTSEEARKIMIDVTENMIAAEHLLTESQDLQSMDYQEKMIRWEHMAKVVDSLKAQIQHESECRLNAVSATLEQLISTRQLSARQKEHQLTELLRAFWEEVTRYNNECLQQTKDLIKKLQQNRSEQTEKLRRAQKGEQVTFLTSIQQTAEPLEFLKDYHNLMEKQREIWCDLEEEEDCKTTEAIADLCKDLYSASSQAFENLVKELLLKTLPTITTVSSGECEHLRQEMRQNMMLELEKADDQRKRSLKLFQEQLIQEKQIWAKEHALSAVLQNHLSEKHEKILQGTINRLNGLSEESATFVFQRHKLLLCSVLRMIALRTIAVATQTQMKVCRKKSLLQEMREQHLVETRTTHCPDENKWQLHKEMESRILANEGAVEEETDRARTEFHQQLLGELQEGLQLLQKHMEQLIGQVLVRHAQQEAAKSVPEDCNKDFKDRLIDTAVESVYVTSSGVKRLVQNFYIEIEKILQISEQGKVKRLKTVEEKAADNRIRKKRDVNDQNMKQKVSGPLTATSGLQHRVLLKRNMLLDYNDVLQNRLQSLKQKKLVISQMDMQLQNKLKEAEQKFIADLSVMAKVHFTEGKQTINQDKNVEIKSKNSHPWEKEGPGELNANNLRPHQQMSQLFRNEQQNLHETDQAKKPTKPLKKRDSL